MKLPVLRNLACLMTALMMVSTVDVHAADDKGKAQKAKKEEERKKKRDEREARNKAIKDFMEGKDANKDGTLSIDEYLTGETDKEAAMKKFNEHNKNGDRSLTKAEITDLLGLKSSDD
jgi:hypothetical protein